MALSVFFVIDAAITANREVDAKDHFTFFLAIPIVFSFIGFGVVNVTKPSDFHDITTEAAKARGFLFIGWVVLLGSSVLALCQCYTHFVGEGTREHPSVGVSLVIATGMLPLATVALWWSKGVVHSSDEFEW